MIKVDTVRIGIATDISPTKTIVIGVMFTNLAIQLWPRRPRFSEPPSHRGKDHGGDLHPAIFAGLEDLGALTGESDLGGSFRGSYLPKTKGTLQDGVFFSDVNVGEKHPHVTN